MAWAAKSATRTIVPKGLFAVTPSDTSDLPRGVVQITVTTTGNIQVDMPDRTAFVIPQAVVDQHGGVLVGQFTRIYSTNTTASGIYAWAG